jgi:xanthine dehydrogenase accessory factor
MLEFDEQRLLDALAHHRAVRVIVERARGSVPRDAGTWMGVVDGDDALVGTIGGGRLEHDAIVHARALLAGATREASLRIPLGPSLGQCCGGVVELRFECHDAGTRSRLRAGFDAERAVTPPIALFGGGHVGRAIVRAMAPLPLRLTWIDSRDEIFPEPAALGLVAWPRSMTMEHSDPVQRAVAGLEPGSTVVVMSYSHAEDFDIVAACLTRMRAANDLHDIALIGSRTKRATFDHRLEARGFALHERARITCPIGLPGIDGKEPEVIAAAVAAQWLGRRARESLRPARRNDVAAINALIVRAKASWGYAPAQVDAWRADLEVSADDVDTRPCVAAVDALGQVAGFAALVPRDASAWDLDNLWVDPPAMGRGLGRRLLWHALHAARTAGAAAVHVDADPNAAAFYAGCGARPDGEVAAPIAGQPSRVRPQFRFDLAPG